MSEFSDLSKEINLMKKLKKKKVHCVALLISSISLCILPFKINSYDNEVYIQ